MNEPGPHDEATPHDAPAPQPRKKKRVRPARKIVARGQMGLQWIVGSLVLAGAILALGLLFLFTRSH